MQVNRIASMTLETARPEDSIEQIALRMRRSNTGFLPVVQEGRLVGVVTDRDIVTQIVAEGREARWAQVDQAMSHPPHWIYEDAEHEDACRMMMDHGVRRLVLCDHDKRPVGVLSLDDLALHGRGDDTVGRVLEHIVACRMVENVLG